MLSAVWSLVFVVVALATTLGWQVSKCRPQHPLGLLPPIVDERGVSVPARWFCAECGRSWPAIFEHGRGPVRRFSGFDQSKAAVARRADELTERQRALALTRAALTRTAPKTKLKSVASLKEPVPIHGRRIAG